MPNTTTITGLQTSAAFLEGGGEMGELMRSKDWTSTPLGSIEHWPLSLRTTLSIMLNSRFPMFLFWGPELTCFYNDAYRPSLGKEGKHPEILGMNGEQAWPEIWHIIKPLIDQVMSGRGATWHEDQFVPIYRNGKIEDVYWTFSYSPIREEAGEIMGVFVTCTETTAKVTSLKKLEESEKKVRDIMMHAPVGITILRGPEYLVEMANNTYLQLVDRKEEDFVGKPLFDSLPEVASVVHPLLKEVLKTGKPQSGIELQISLYRHGKKETAYFNFIYQPAFNEKGDINGIIVVANEVTAMVEARHNLEESRQQFSDIVMQSPIGMAIFRGPDHVIEMANNEILRNMWRREQKEVIGKKIMEIFPGLASQKYPALLESVFRQGRTYREKEALAYIDGNDGNRKFYVDYEYSPISNQAGEIWGIMVSVNDVTEKVEARLKIQESERKFRLLADSMPQHIWTSDPQGNINYYNKSVFSYSGLSMEKLTEGGWLQIIHPDDRLENEQRWMQSISTGEAFLFEHRFRKFDGSYRWQLSRALPVKDSEGKIQMWVGTSTDIDEIKRHQQEREDFIKIASHELKTPVTTIKAYTQLLLREVSLTQDHFMERSLFIIDKQVTKLTKLITQLLDVTKIELGRFQAEKEMFAANELITDIVNQLQATTPTHQFIFTPGTDVILHADRDRISQVLINLLTNAVKYSPGAGRVIIDTNLDEEMLTVSIRDFGIGMSPSDHDKIFDRFYRAEGTGSKTFQGFGIGLYIVKEIITQHGGEVWLESEKEKGSVFYFSLPV